MADNTFSKSYRLLSAKDFSFLKKNAACFKHRHFRIFYKSSRISTSKNSRIGIAVSKKVGKAHDRNLLKRIVREEFRKSSLRSMVNLDMLLTVSPYFYKNVSDPRVELREAVNFAFSQISKKSKESLT